MADIYNDPSIPPTPVTPPEAPEDVALQVERTVVSRPPAGDVPQWQQVITEWLRDNQVLAMAGGFALGVFLGVLMRD